MSDLAVMPPSTDRIVKLDETRVRVNLNARPRNPLDPEGPVSRHVGGGWAEVLCCSDALYVDGVRVVLYVLPAQMYGRCGSVQYICEQIAHQQSLNANIRDALLEYPHLVPEYWNRYRSVLFCSTTFLDASGSPFVCCLSRDVSGVWFPGEYWMSDSLNNQHASACLET